MLLSNTIRSHSMHAHFDSLAYASLAIPATIALQLYTMHIIKCTKTCKQLVDAINYASYHIRYKHKFKSFTARFLMPVTQLVWVNSVTCPNVLYAFLITD